jgi:hypothetical protein
MSKIIIKPENYEGKFKMDSETFYKKYSSGEVGDGVEYIKWAGEIETLRKLELRVSPRI